MEPGVVDVHQALSIPAHFTYMQYSGHYHPQAGLGKPRLAIGLVNGWLSALQWEQFWGVKAGGNHSTEALASVTAALHYATQQVSYSLCTQSSRCLSRTPLTALRRWAFPHIPVVELAGSSSWTQIPCTCPYDIHMWICNRSYLQLLKCAYGDRMCQHSGLYSYTERVDHTLFSRSTIVDAPYNKEIIPITPNVHAKPLA